MFEIRIEDQGHATLTGRLDAAQADAAAGALARLSGPAVLDCSGLDYISSAGLGLLIETYKRLHAAGHPLRLTGVQPRVKSVFRIANLDALLGIE